MPQERPIVYSQQEDAASVKLSPLHICEYSASSSTDKGSNNNLHFFSVLLRLHNPYL